MKSTHYKVIVILIFSMLISGCYKAGIRPEEVKIKPDIIVVPFKAAPITMKSWGIGTILLFGPLGARIADEASAEGREEIANTLNKIRGQWDPSVVCAQECLNLTKKSTVLQISNITIVDTRELPGVEALRQKEPRPFTAKLGGLGTTLAGEWMNAGSRWLKKDNSTIQYRQDYPQSNADWALEVFSSYGMITKGETIEFNVIVKLIKTSSGEKIAVGWAYDNFKISPIKENSDFKVFEEEYRRAANQLCSKALSEMSLIAEQ